jgi:hypothetical protein
MEHELTIGVDLGDKTSRYCVLDREGQVLFERSTATTKKGLAQAFASMGARRIAMEVGTHSPWVKTKRFSRRRQSGRPAGAS